MVKEKERVIATKISAKIFGEAQLTDMQIHGGWGKGDLKDLLERSLTLFSQVNNLYKKGEKLPQELIEFVISHNINDVEEKLKSLTKKKNVK